MTLQETMQALESLGTEQTRKTWANHGAQEPYFGVKVGDLKGLVKKIKKDHALSLQLFDTGNADAMYLAGLIADEKQITKADLQNWAEKANWTMLSEYTVAWVAAESPHGWELGLEWIQNSKDNISSAGWNTLAGWLALHPDEKLNVPKIEALLKNIETTIHSADNRTKYTMNGFVIAVGSYVLPLRELAGATAQAIGKVNVMMGGTACKVPSATEYIDKVNASGKAGQKKKMVRC